MIVSKVSKSGKVVDGVGGSLTTVIPLPVRYSLGVYAGDSLVWEVKRVKDGLVAVVRPERAPRREKHQDE
ncbi:MAG: hypothetical protein JRM97_09490 [Nitrososphaerota archaeon]|nr:hypothetical protein [Nitrososphaerota archaeon]